MAVPKIAEFDASVKSSARVERNAAVRKSSVVISSVNPSPVVEMPFWKLVLQFIGGFLSTMVFFILVIVIFIWILSTGTFSDIEEIAFPFALASALFCAGSVFLAWRFRARNLIGLFWGLIIGVMASALLAGILIFLIYNFSM